MSYNPHLSANFYKTTQPRHAPDFRAGTTHGEIMKRHGIGSTLPNQNRVNTATGIAVELFSGPFVVRSELMSAGNSSGKIVNSKKDRVILVQKGTLCVLVNKEEIPRQIKAGNVFVAKKKEEYEIATLGNTDVELVFIEEPDYASNVKVLSEGNVRAMDTSSLMSGLEETTPPRVRTSDQSKSLEASLEIAKVRNSKKENTHKTINILVDSPNSDAVLGISPKPLGPGAFEY
jgi:hypothetical protein